MKKFLVGAVAIVIAATSFVGTASADHQRYKKKWNGNHYAYGHSKHEKYERQQKRVTRRVITKRDTCVIRTYKRVNSNGDVIIDRVRSC